MHTKLSILLPLLLGLGGCTASSDEGDDGAAATEADASTGGADDGSGPGSDTNPVTTDPTTGATTLPPPGDTGDETGTAMGFDFDDTPPDEMTQVDRMGMPAINTAVIASKDDYNASSPADDAAGVFVDEIVASLEFLHGALDDDLMAADLVPCAVKACVGQAAPLVVPDVLHIDPSADPGFPNGRLPADPVIDVTLAVVLLDLTAEGQTAATLAGLPLNPPANDVAFSDEFPFLAEPH